jgi:glutamate decarboxylase
LGFDDYIEMENALSNARLPSKALEATGWYTCMSDIHHKKGAKELVFGKENDAFRFSGDFKKQHPHIHQKGVGTLLRVRQYVVPNRLPFHVHAACLCLLPLR